MTKVTVSAIPEEGLRLSFLEEPDALDLSIPGGRCVAPIAGDVFLRKADQSVLIAGQMMASVMFECVRCLREFSMSLEIPLSTQFVPPFSLPSGTHPMPPSEAEDYYYRDDVLDLDELAREEMLLAVPLNPQCRADCLGLCPRCGQDLNQGTCLCAPPPDPRWSVLRQRVTGTDPR